MFSRSDRRKRQTHRKHSPDPSSRESSTAMNEMATPVATGGRRRHHRSTPGEDSHSNSTLLPTSFRPTDSPSSNSKSRPLRRPPSQLPTFQAGNTCNNFLLGGQFYPGKDKKRKQMRRRTVWYRMFCSSPWRMVVSLVLFSYLLVWQVLVPTTQVLMEYGRILSGRKAFLRGTLDLPPLKQQRKEALRLQEERERLQLTSRQRHGVRLKMWQDIVPEFFNRNKKVTTNQKPPATVIKGGNKEGPLSNKSEESKSASEDHTAKPVTNAKTKTKLKKKPSPTKKVILEPNTDSKYLNKTDFRRDHITVEETGSKSVATNVTKTKNRVPANATKSKSAARTETLKIRQDKLQAKNKTNIDTATNGNMTARLVPDSDGSLKDREKRPMKITDLIIKSLDAEPTNITADKKNSTFAAMKDGPNVTLVKDAATALNTTLQDVSPDKLAQNKTSVQRTLFNLDTLPSQSSCPVNLAPKALNTTLVLQSSVDRLWILNETCFRWQDPIVVVVYFVSPDDAVEESLASLTKICKQLTVVRYHAGEGALTQEYPVNQLRNLGLDAVTTSHVLLVDVDFVPSMNLDETIRTSLLENPGLVEVPEAIVVPAFERIPPQPCSATNDCTLYLKQNSSFLPRKFDELRSCVSDEHCSVFQQSVNPAGHHSTRSSSWLKGDWYDEAVGESNSTLKRIRRLKCFDSLRYEPYVVLRWCPSSTKNTRQDSLSGKRRPMAPYYDERFYGYGKNKIQLISHLRFMGYQFSVLPRGFIVHSPHPESDVKQVWNNVGEYDLHDKMDELYPRFLKELWNKYKDSTDLFVGECEKKKKKRSSAK